MNDKRLKLPLTTHLDFSHLQITLIERFEVQDGSK